MEQFVAASPRLQKQFTKWRNGGWKKQQDLLPDNWQIDRQLHLHVPLDSLEVAIVDSDTSDSKQISTS